MSLRSQVKAGSQMERAVILMWIFLRCPASRDFEKSDPHEGRLKVGMEHKRIPNCRKQASCRDLHKGKQEVSSHIVVIKVGMVSINNSPRLKQKPSFWSLPSGPLSLKTLLIPCSHQRNLSNTQNIQWLTYCLQDKA